jgi:type IX secretion system PorP/SprF family membrane protein
MKKLLIIFFCLVFGSLKAQQLPQYSQYLLNRYVINPATAGTNDYFLGQTNYRSQWEGVQDAPRTYILSVNGPLKNQKIIISSCCSRIDHITVQ